MPLNDTRIRAAKADTRPYKLGDFDGLSLHVQPSGSKWWRFRYRFLGKEKMLSLGTYPEVGLLEARQRRDAARKLVASGIDPAANVKMIDAPMPPFSATRSGRWRTNGSKSDRRSPPTAPAPKFAFTSTAT